MGTYSLEYYRKHGVVKDISKPCKPPFHKKKNVDIVDEVCMRCRVKVFWNAHPSLDKPRWYTAT